jgi:tubulin polyglutamylase TTLL9
MKPIARSQGKGIFLFNKLAQITQWKSEYRWKPENAAVSGATNRSGCSMAGGNT